jgi:hypothetical protein
MNMTNRLLFIKVLILTIIFILPLPSQVLYVRQTTQEQDQWCWAGVTCAILKYYDQDIAQCTIAEYTRTQAAWHDFGSVDCCADPSQGCNYWNYLWGSGGSVADILFHWGVTSSSYTSYLTQNTIQTQINGFRPFVIRWGWSSGGGHFLVGHGIEGSSIYYMDPWFGEGLKIADYSWVVSGGSHTWTHTQIISTTPTEPATPTLILPPNGAIHQPLTVSLSWNATVGAHTCWLQVATDSAFNDIIFDDPMISGTTRDIDGLLPSTKYFWHVCAENNAGASSFSATFSFQTSCVSSVATSYAANWNLISISAKTTDYRKNFLFPSAVSDAFSYENGSYHTKDTLTNGAGYWLKFDSPQQISFCGEMLSPDTIDVVEGWNIIGALSDSLAVTNITLVGTSISSAFFGYDNDYIAADTLLPGKGYWIKVDHAGKLVLGKTK